MRRELIGVMFLMIGGIVALWSEKFVPSVYGVVVFFIIFLFVDSFKKLKKDKKSL